MSSASPSSLPVRSLPVHRRLLSGMHIGQSGSLFSGGFWAICDQAAVSLASFVATVIVGRICSPEELGVFTLAVGGFWLIVGFPNALVWIPYTSRAPRMKEKRQARYSGSVLIHLGVMMLLVAGTLGACAFAVPEISQLLGYELPHQDQFFTVCLAMIPFALLMMVREHVRRVLTAHLRMKEMFLVDLPIACVQIGLLWTLAHWGKLSAETALLAIAAACSLSVFSLLIRHGETSFRGRSTWLHFAYNFHFGRWLIVGSIAWMLSENSFRWLMVSFHGRAALGQMAAALSIVLLVNPLLVSICNFARAVMANRLAELGPSGMRALVRRSSFGMAIVFGLAFTILAIFGGSFVTVLYGDEYAGQQWVVASLCLAMFFRALTVPVDAALMAVRSGRELAIASVVQLLLAISFGLPLVYSYGGVGVGIALAVSCCGSLLARWYFFQKRDFQKHDFQQCDRPVAAGNNRAS